MKEISAERGTHAPIWLLDEDESDRAADGAAAAAATAEGDADRAAGAMRMARSDLLSMVVVVLVEVAMAVDVRNARPTVRERARGQASRRSDQTPKAGQGKET